MKAVRMTHAIVLGVASAVVGTCALAALSTDALSADQPPKVDNDVRVFMRAKLDASSKILEGLTTENYPMIREGAKSLQAMSQAEKWRVTNDPLYRQYSIEFTRVAERLSEKANSRSIDGAT
ncbi:MAG: hypothetical protein AB7V46_24750, partial [Thermomicrobiales bacterium]